MKFPILLFVIALGLSSACADDTFDKIKAIQRLRKSSQVLFEAKKYDVAFSCCDQILELDPYDVPARRRQEEINLTRINIINAKRAKPSRDDELIYPTLPPQYLGKPLSSKTSK